MDKLKAIQTDLETARNALIALQDDLPQFHALLTDNERAAETKRRERASLDAQAQAKNRVMVAREMLEQHQSDIATARAEVSQLEALEHREELLLEMCGAADEAKARRTGIDRAMETAQKALGKAVTTLYREWAAERAARQRFTETGRELVPHLGQLGGHWQRHSPEGIALNTLTAELCKRGADLGAATDSATGPCTALDAERRGLPRDELSMLVICTHDQRPEIDAALLVASLGSAFKLLPFRAGGDDGKPEPRRN